MGVFMAWALRKEMIGSRHDLGIAVAEIMINYVHSIHDSSMKCLWDG